MTEQKTKRAVPERDRGEGESLSPGRQTPADHAAGSEPSRSVSGTDIHAYIGRQLRAVYDDVANQPVPDRFLDLIKQLDARTGGR